MQWFEDTPVLARMAPDDFERKLAEIEPQNEAPVRGGWFAKKAYQHVQHAFGYIEMGVPGSAEPIPLQHAGNIIPDKGLRGARVTITLDRMKVAAYPGWGARTVLFDFYAENHVEQQAEPLHFNQTFRAQEEQFVGVIGLPIFSGLTVGKTGLAFKCFTVNVQNELDQQLLTFLDSPAFQSGLKLAKTMQPAIVPFANSAFALTKHLAKQHKNVPVQDFYMGLDFSSVATRARLREGSYVAIQTDEIWDWSEWAYYPSTGSIGHCEQANRPIPYNYIVFSLSRDEDEEPPVTIAEPETELPQPDPAPVPSPRQGPAKRALLIGINSYPKLSGRYQLGGCVQDVALIADALQSKFGFLEENTWTLTDEAATRDGILGALDQLVADTGQDDVVVIHYSGHGSQMTDRDGDEPDGLDETLMPSDSGRGTDENRDITDDELYLRLLALGKKTRFITLIFDCCHSGTISRDPSGANMRYVPADKRPITALPASPISAQERGILSQNKTRSASNWLPLRDGYVLLSACRDEEFAYEYQGSGALTHFLIQALQDAQSGVTYQALFEQVHPHVTATFPYQHPQLEGVSDRLLFGVKEIAPVRYIEVREQMGSQVTLNAGLAHGLTEWSTYAICAPGAVSAESPLTTATIKTLDTTSATADLNTMLTLPTGCRAFETAHVYPAMQLSYRTVIADEYSDEEAVQDLAKQLQNLACLQEESGTTDIVVYLLAPRTRVTENAPVPQLGTIEHPVWAVVGRDGFLKIPAVSLPDGTAIIPTYLERLTQYKNVLALKNSASTNPLRDRIRVNVNVLEGRASRALTGERVLFEGDIIEVVVHNDYSETVYVSLLDLGLTGRIMVIPKRPSQAIFPGKNLSIKMRMGIPDDFPLAPARQGLVMDRGMEVFKVFVTLDSADFRPLIQNSHTNSVTRNLSYTPLKLVQAALAGTPIRDAYPVGSKAALWDTIDIAFQMAKG